MSLKDFLKEEREEKKKRRELQKKQKKKVLTKDEKKHKIFGIIFGFLVTFGAIFYSCSNMGGGYSWNSLIGITDEMITALETEVDESKLIPNGRIGANELQETNQILSTVGINLFDQEAETNTKPTADFSLNSRQIGVIAKEVVSEVEGYISMTICDLEFYVIGESVYEKSVTYVNLSNYVTGATLPYVYLTTISKIEVLDNEITAMTNESIINNLDKVTSDEIMAVINKNSSSKLDKMSSSLINGAINIFIETTSCNISLGHDQIKFKV